MNTVTDLQSGDFFRWNASERKPTRCVKPRDDIRVTTGVNGSKVHIVSPRFALENCVTDRGMVHVHTDRGTVCVSREATVLIESGIAI